MKQALREKIIIFLVLFLILYYIGNPSVEEQFLQGPGLAEQEVGFSGDQLLSASTCFDDGEAGCKTQRATIESNVNDQHAAQETARKDAIEEADDWVGDPDAEEGTAIWHFSNYIPLSKCDDCRGMGDIKLSQVLNAEDTSLTADSLTLRYHNVGTATSPEEAVKFENEGRFTSVNLADREGRQDDFEPSKEWVANMCLKDPDCLGFQIDRAEGSAKLISYVPGTGPQQIEDPDNDDEATDVYFLHPYRALKWQETGQALPDEPQIPIPRPKNQEEWRARIKRLTQINPKYTKDVTGNVNNILDTIPDTNPKNAQGVWSDSSVNKIMGEDDDDGDNLATYNHGTEIYSRRRSRGSADNRAQAIETIKSAIAAIEPLKTAYDAEKAVYDSYIGDNGVWGQAKQKRDADADAVTAAEQLVTATDTAYKDALKLINVQLVDGGTGETGAVWDLARATALVQKYETEKDIILTDKTKAQTWLNSVDHHMDIMKGKSTYSVGADPNVDIYDPEKFAGTGSNANPSTATRWAPHLLPNASPTLKAFPQLSIHEMDKHISELTAKLNPAGGEGTFKKNYDDAKAEYDAIRGSYLDNVWQQKNNYPEFGHKKWEKDPNAEPPDRSKKGQKRLGPTGSGIDNGWHGEWFDTHYHNDYDTTQGTAAELALKSCTDKIDDIILGNQGQTVNVDNRFHFLTTIGPSGATIVDQNKRDNVFSCKNVDGKDYKTATRQLWTERQTSLWLPPDNIRVLVGDDQIGTLTVKWDTPPDSSGRPAIQGYDIQRRTGSQAYWTTVLTNEMGSSASNNTRKWIDYGPLTNGTRYYYRMRTKNNVALDGGYGRWSDEDDFGQTLPGGAGVGQQIVYISPPPKPANVKIQRTAAYETNGRLRVFWTDDQSNHYSGNATHFKLERSQNGEAQPKNTQVWDIIAEFDTSVSGELSPYEYIDDNRHLDPLVSPPPGLSHDRKYWYRVSVKNSDKNTEWSDSKMSEDKDNSSNKWKKAKNNSQVTPINPNQIAFIYDGNNGYIRVRWKKSLQQSGVPSVTGYTITRLAVGAPDGTSPTVIHSPTLFPDKPIGYADGESDWRKFTDTNGDSGFANGAQLIYEVVSYNSNGRSVEPAVTGMNKDTATAVTNAPGKPTITIGQISSPNRNGSVHMSWTIPGGPPITEFEIHRKAHGEDAFEQAATFTGTITQFKDGNDHVANSTNPGSVAPLVHGGTYTYKIRAKNTLNLNWGTWSQTKSSVVSQSDIIKQGPVRELAGQNIVGEDGKIKLTWKKPEQNLGAADINNYHVVRGLDADGSGSIDNGETWGGTNLINSQPPNFQSLENNKKSFTDTSGLIHNRSYLYKVAAENVAGVGAQETTGPINVIIQPPKIQDVKVNKQNSPAGVKDGRLLVKWKTSSASQDPTHFMILRYPAPATPGLTTINHNGKAYVELRQLVESTLTQGSDDYYYSEDGPGLQHNGTYYYLVSARRSITGVVDTGYGTQVQYDVKGSSNEPDAIDSVKWPKVTDFNVNKRDNQLGELELVFKKPPEDYTGTKKVDSWRIHYSTDYTPSAPNSATWQAVPFGDENRVKNNYNCGSGSSSCDKKGYIHKGLVNDVMYYYRVAAYNSAGQSEWSDQTMSTSQTVLVQHPPRPSTVKIERENEADGSLKVFWTNDSNNHYSGYATHFKLERSRNGGDSSPSVWEIVATLTDSSQASDTNVQPFGYEYIDGPGLSDGRKYWYRVSVKNSDKNTGWSPTQMGQAKSDENQKWVKAINDNMATPNNPDEMLFVYDADNGYIKVRWKKSSERGNTTVNGYTLSRIPVNAPDGTLPTVIHSPTLFPLKPIGRDDAESNWRYFIDTNEDSGFSNLVPYEYQIFATNSNGDSGEDPKSAIAIAEANPPGKPTLSDVTPSNLRNGSVHLQWAMNTAPSGNITKFELHRKAHGEDAFEQAATFTGTITQFKDGNDHVANSTNPGSVAPLVHGQQYEYKIKAMNSLNAGWSQFSNTKSHTVNASDIIKQGLVQDLAGENIITEDGEIKVSWKKPAANGATDDDLAYHIQRGRDADETGSIDNGEIWETLGSQSPTSGTNNYNDTGLLGGEDYIYRVAAENKAGLGLWDETAATQVTIKPPKISQAIIVKTDNSGHLTMYWNAEHGDASKATHFKIELKVALAPTLGLVGVVPFQVVVEQPADSQFFVSDNPNYSYSYKHLTEQINHNLTHTYKISARNSQVGTTQALREGVLLPSGSEFGNYDSNLYKEVGKKPNSSDVILPVPPTLTVSTINDDETGRLKLDWQPRTPPPGAKDITKWLVETGFDGATWVPLNATSSGGFMPGEFGPSQRSSFHGPGLLNNQTYYYRIRSYNAVGPSQNYSTPVQQVAKVYAPKIYNVTVISSPGPADVKDGRLLVKWKTSSASQDPTHFMILRYPAPATPGLTTINHSNGKAYVELTRLVKSTLTQNSDGSYQYEDGPGLQHNVTYYYLVSARRNVSNPGDTGYAIRENALKGSSKTVNAIDNVTWPKVTNFNVKQIHNQEAKLELVFKKPSQEYTGTNDITGWQIAYSTNYNPSAPDDAEWEAVPSNSDNRVKKNYKCGSRGSCDKKGYIHKSLIDGQAYYYVVAGYNSAGRSEWSDVVRGVVQIKPPPGQVKNVSVKRPPKPGITDGPTASDGNRIKDGGLYVQWKKQDDATNYIIERRVGSTGTWEFVYDTIVEEEPQDRMDAASHLDQSEHSEKGRSWADPGQTRGNGGMFTYTESTTGTFPYAFSLGPPVTRNFMEQEPIGTTYEKYDSTNENLLGPLGDQLYERNMVLYDSTRDYRKDSANYFGWIDYSFKNYTNKPPEKEVYYRVYARDYNIPVVVDRNLTKLENATNIFAQQVGPASATDSIKYSDEDVRKPIWDDGTGGLSIVQGAGPNYNIAVSWNEADKNYGKDLRDKPYTVTNPNNKNEVFFGPSSNTQFVDTRVFYDRDKLEYKVCAENKGSIDVCETNSINFSIPKPAKPAAPGVTLDDMGKHYITWVIPSDAKYATLYGYDSTQPGWGWLSKVSRTETTSLTLSYNLARHGANMSYLLKVHGPRGGVSSENSDVVTYAVNAYKMMIPAGPKSIWLSNIGITGSGTGKLRINITINAASVITLLSPHTAIQVLQRKYQKIDSNGTIVSAVGNWVAIKWDNTTSTSRSVDITGLELNHLYQFAVRTYNSSGNNYSGWLLHAQTRSTAHKLPAPPQTPNINVVNGVYFRRKHARDATINWTRVNAASGYYVNIYDQNGTFLRQHPVSQPPSGNPNLTDRDNRCGGSSVGCIVKYYVYSISKDNWKQYSPGKEILHHVIIEQPIPPNGISQNQLNSEYENGTGGRWFADTYYTPPWKYEGKGQKDGRLKIWWSDMTSYSNLNAKYKVRFRYRDTNNNWGQYRYFTTSKNIIYTRHIPHGYKVEIGVSVIVSGRSDGEKHSAYKNKTMDIVVAEKNKKNSSGSNKKHQLYSSVLTPPQRLFYGHLLLDELAHVRNVDFWG